MRAQLATLGIVLTLAGCAGTVPDSQPGSPPQTSGGFLSGLFQYNAVDADGDAATRTPEPLEQVALLRDTIVIDPPSGYCIDAAALSDTPRNGFAMIASCRILSGGLLARPVQPAIVTVSAVPARASMTVPKAADMMAEARSDSLQVVEDTGLTLVHLTDGGDAVIPNGDPKYWRAAARINEAMLGFALYAPEDSPLAGTGGLRFLREVIENISRESGSAPAQAEATNASATTQPGLLTQLFGNRAG